MNDLGRRERVQLEGRIALLHRTEEIFVPVDWQIRVVAALKKELDAADRNRLVDLLEDLVEAEHVTVSVSHRAVEGAEVTACDADVRVVDIAVDDVRDDSLGMLAGADLVRHAREPVGRRLAIQE